MYYTIDMTNNVYRCYPSHEINNNIKENYKEGRHKQCLLYVTKMRQKFNNRIKEKVNFWDVFEKLSNFIDISDPDVDIPNSYHAFQTAESARKDGMPEWFILTCLIHDMGKIMYVWGNDENGTSINKQWGIVGDTFIVGCKIPNTIVYPEFNNLNSDHKKHKNSLTGMYKKNCGLNKCIVSWGHDEFMFRVLLNNKNKLPDEAYYIIRYHSLYLWHYNNEYKYIENDYDKKMKHCVKTFNKYDLYTKTNTLYSPEEVEGFKTYYSKLINYYFGTEELFW